MTDEQIRDEARKAANRSQFMSNWPYDYKSYEDGFCEGMNQALRKDAGENQQQAIAAAVADERRRVWDVITARTMATPIQTDRWDELICLRYELFPDGEPKQVNPPAGERREM